jgi:hypothetical protein
MPGSSGLINLDVLTFVNIFNKFQEILAFLNMLTIHKNWRKTTNIAYQML